MQRFFVVLAVVVVSLLTGIGLLVSSARPGPAVKVGYPHFACVAAWNIGICIGPPTQ